ncbi:MAG: winged helix-turn-helix domain-containing protein [Nitrososphaera sp.]
MSNFKEAAIVVLKKSSKPLTSKEIVSEAIEQGLIVTQGLTPHASLNSLIIRDIQKKGERSAFLKVGRGLYILNPNYKK